MAKDKKDREKREREAKEKDREKLQAKEGQQAAGAQQSQTPKHANTNAHIRSAYRDVHSITQLLKACHVKLSHFVRHLYHMQGHFILDKTLVEHVHEFEISSALLVGLFKKYSLFFDKHVRPLLAQTPPLYVTVTPQPMPAQQQQQAEEQRAQQQQQMEDVSLSLASLTRPPRPVEP